MIRSILSLSSILAILTLTFAMPLSAQTNLTKQEEKTAEIRDKVRKLGLGERVKIKITTYGKTTYQGYVNAANEDDFVVIDKSGNPNTIKYSDEAKVGGRNLSTGAKIGIGIGIGVGAVVLFLGIVFASLND